MTRVSFNDKREASHWLRSNPRKAARIQRGMIKFIARIARKQRKARHRRTR
jgi:hypothetical protein